MKKSSVAIASGLSSLALVLSGCGGTPTESNSAPNGASASPNHSPATSSSSMTSGSSDAASTDSSFKDGVLTTPDVRIEITKHKVIPAGKKGNEYGDKPVIAFWYKITNVSGKKADPMAFIFDITAYQDNNPNAENKLEVGSLPDDRFGESQTETIKKGGTVENAIAYELDDLKTPVDLVASDDLGMTEIGRVTYELK